jgi:hypothetical protein
MDDQTTFSVSCPITPPAVDTIDNDLYSFVFPETNYLGKLNTASDNMTSASAKPMDGENGNLDTPIISPGNEGDRKGTIIWTLNETTSIKYP